MGMEGNRMNYEAIAQGLEYYRVKAEVMEFHPWICQKAAEAIRELLKERDAAIDELNRIEEFCENEFLGYLNNTVHHDCGYEYFSQLFDLLCEVTNWQYDETWNHKNEG